MSKEKIKIKKWFSALAIVLAVTGVFAAMTAGLKSAGAQTADPPVLLSINLSSDTPQSQTIPVTNDWFTAAKFQISPSAAVSINKITINKKPLGSNELADMKIDKVQLFTSASQTGPESVLSDEQSLTSKRVLFNLASSPWPLGGGVPQFLIVKAKLKPSANPDAGKSLALGIKEARDIETTTAVQKNGSFPLYGNEMTVAQTQAPRPPACANGKILSDDETSCVCPSGSSEYTGSSTTYLSPSACLPCGQNELVDVSGILYCPSAQPPAGPISDDVPPAVQITSPSADAQISGTIPISANATDNNSQISRVEFFVDGNLVFTDNSPPYSYPWNSTGTQNGAHQIIAKAYDATENMTIANISVTVSNQQNSADQQTTLTCEQQGRFTYSGPARPGVSTNQCINCPLNLFVRNNGVCPTAGQNTQGGANAQNPQNILPALDSMSGQSALLTQNQISQQTQQQTAEHQINAAQFRPSAPEQNLLPDLQNSMRLSAAPERANTGPAVLIYFALAGAVNAGFWIFKKRRF